MFNAEIVYDHEVIDNLDKRLQEVEWELSEYKRIYEWNKQYNIGLPVTVETRFNFKNKTKTTTEAYFLEGVGAVVDTKWRRGIPIPNFTPGKVWLYDGRTSEEYDELLETIDRRRR